MRRIDLVNTLDKEVGLIILCKSGVIQWTELRDRDIYLQYDIYIRMGKPIMDAKYQTAEDFKVEVTTVKRAIWKMNEKICNTPHRTEGKA
jgi:hypothetical protein